MAWNEDVLNREPVAEFLTAFLEGDDEAKVLNIDAPWGVGKTYFVTNWHESRLSSYGSVYFNAWEIDYSGEPFFDLVSSIRDQLLGQAPTKKVEEAAKSFLEKSAQVAIKAGPEIGKLLIKGALKKVLATDLGDIENIVTEAGYNAAESVIVDLLEKNAEAKKAVTEFKGELQNLIDVVASEKSFDGKSVGNVFIFIDELDRCRPTYAIELLERVKHLFDVPGCRFIIATDTKQLSHSIRAVYGVGFDSSRYLKRFFDATFRLINDDQFAWAKVCLESVLKANVYDIKPRLKRIERNSHFLMGGAEVVQPHDKAVMVDYSDVNSHHACFVAIIKTFDLSLRDVQKIMLHVRGAVPNIKVGPVHLFILLYLTALRYQDHELFLKLREGWGKELEEDLNKKYPPYCLYYVSVNLTVHNIAKIYVEAMTLNNLELRGRINGLGDLDPPFAGDVLVSAGNDKLAKYFDIVEMAGYVS